MVFDEENWLYDDWDNETDERFFEDEEDYEENLLDDDDIDFLLKDSQNYEIGS